jgi:hypothetical protein
MITNCRELIMHESAEIPPLILLIMVAREQLESLVIVSAFLNIKFSLYTRMLLVIINIHLVTRISYFANHSTTAASQSAIHQCSYQDAPNKLDIGPMKNSSN